MKKIAIFLILLIYLLDKNVLADVAKNLKNRLNKVSSFHSIFIQKVIDESGNILQESYGDLWVKRPNFFNWHTIQPEENILVSDGKTLWFYNPFIEQVTAIWLKDVISKTPFILIINNQTSDWKQYDIKQTDDNFELTPKIGNNNLKKFTINVNSNGTINQFSAVEQNDQCNIYKFQFQQNCAIDESIFVFTPPHGVTVDDQRIDK